MNLNNFTIRSQEAIQQAFSIAAGYQYQAVENGHLLKQTITPEFFNRIDEIILFPPLTFEEIKQIAGLQFNIIKKSAGASGIDLSLTDKATEWFAKKG